MTRSASSSGGSGIRTWRAIAVLVGEGGSEHLGDAAGRVRLELPAVEPRPAASAAEAVSAGAGDGGGGSGGGGSGGGPAGTPGERAAEPAPASSSAVVRSRSSRNWRWRASCPARKLRWRSASWARWACRRVATPRSKAAGRVPGGGSVDATGAGAGGAGGAAPSVGGGMAVDLTPTYRRQRGCRCHLLRRAPVDARHQQHRFGVGPETQGRVGLEGRPDRRGLRGPGGRLGEGHLEGPAGHVGDPDRGGAAVGRAPLRTVWPPTVVQGERGGREVDQPRGGVGVADLRHQALDAFGQPETQLGRAGAVEHRVDPVAPREGVGEPAQDQHHRRVARELAVGREEGGGRGPVDRLAREVHRAHQGGIELPGAQRAGGDAEGDQAGALLGRDRERRSPEVELARHPVGHDVGHGPDHRGRIEGRDHRVARSGEPARVGVGLAGDQPPARPPAGHLRVGAHADQHPGPLPRQVPCVVGGFPCRGEQGELLGQCALEVVGGKLEPGELDLDVLGPGVDGGAAEECLGDLVATGAVTHYRPQADDGERLGAAIGLGGCGARRGSVGSSTIRWASLPPKPKAERPARRGTVRPRLQGEQRAERSAFEGG